MSPAPDESNVKPSTPSKVFKEQDTTTWKEAPMLYLKTFAMGAADVVPGVSGGTMALILGIYARLLSAIKSLSLDAIKALLTFNIPGFFKEFHWKFSIFLVAGIFSALMFFTKIVPLPEYMYTRPELIYGLFFGLIAGSVVLLLWSLEKLSPGALLSMLAGAVSGFIIVTLIPTDTPDTPLFLFFTGSVAISALVLPGVSGSFILLILRQYDTILGAIGNLGTVQTIEALYVLVPFGIGATLGLAMFARGLSWLLKRYYGLTLCLLIGFMMGSLYIIWPFQEQEYIQVKSSYTVPADSEAARQAMEATDSRRAPEVLMFDSIINPEAPEDEQIAELILVRNRLISSRPFWPLNPAEDERLADGHKSVYQGFGMMSLGLLAVLLLGWVARRN